MNDARIVWGAIVFAVGLLGIVVALVLSRRARGTPAALRARRPLSSKVSTDRGNDISKELNRLDQSVSEIREEKKNESFELLLYQAGCFSDAQRQKFYRMRILGPVFGLCFSLFFTATVVGFGSSLSLLFPIVGVLLGVRIPNMKLDNLKKQRKDEILFYLPIVIEQMVIGVSSSLDIGPCLQRILEMSDERDRSNAVIELLEQVMIKVRSGNTLDDSLSEVGALVGIPELKHAFNAIGQVARHGGEVSKQLKELADAVTVQREVDVEGAIKKLELKATAPVALAFIAFLVTLFTGIGCMLMNSTNFG